MKVKALETKATIANSRGQNYTVIAPYLSDSKSRSTDPIFTFHSNLKSAVVAVCQFGGTITKTNDHKNSLAHQKEGGTVHILANILSASENKRIQMRVR